MADLSPQYTGTQYAVGQAPAATISAENPELRRDFERNAQATLGSIIQLDDELMEANDFALQQNRIPRVKALADNLEKEMAERRALPDGDPNALFDKNGKFRQDLFNARVSSYTNQLKGMDSGFMTTRGQEFARKAIGDTRAAIEQYAATSARAALKERAFRSFENNFYDAMNAGQYNLAISYAIEAQKNKILPQGADSIYDYTKKLKKHAASEQAGSNIGLSNFIRNLPGCNIVPGVSTAAPEPQTADTSAFTVDLNMPS